MNLFGGWPFYHGAQRSRNDPRHTGYYDRRPCGPMEQPLYDDYHPCNLFSPDWYPEIYSNPFHRPNRRPSPFETRRPSPFDSMFGEPRKPARSECRCAPQQDVNTSTMVADEEPTVQDTVNMESRRAGEKEQSNSDHIVMQTEPVTKDIVNDQAETPNSQEVQSTNTSELIPEILKINEIVEKTVKLENNISSFEGARGSKQYIFIEENLVSLLLLLDKVETNGNIDIRKARKSAVCQIQQLLSDLEDKTKTDNAATSGSEVSSDEAEDGSEDESEDVSITENMFSDTEGSTSEVEDDNMEVDVQPECNGEIEKNLPSDNARGDTSCPESSVTEAPSKDTTTPVTDMDTSSLLSDVEEDMPQSDNEVSEAPTEDINTDDTSIDIVTKPPSVTSPSDDEDTSS